MTYYFRPRKLVLLNEIPTEIKIKIETETEIDT